MPIECVRVTGSFHARRVVCGQVSAWPVPTVSSAFILDEPKVLKIDLDKAATKTNNIIKKFTSLGKKQINNSK